MTIEARLNIRRGNFVLKADLQIAGQGITALFGSSGCGKTSILRAIAGLDQHADTFIRVGEQVWQSDKHFIAPHLRSIGYVFQEASLFEHRTVSANLEYGLKRVPDRLRRISLEQVVKLLDIGYLLERKAGTLSGGERQRVAIARALAVSPELLLMDEPVSALDTPRKNEILQYIELLSSKLDIPVIYVSHAMDEVARLADQMLIIDQGNLVASGNVHGMLTRLDLPLAHDENAAAIIDAVVAEHDEEFHLTYLDFDDGRFTVARNDLDIGSRVRLRIAARDVSLTLTHQVDTSILNIFPATVEEISSQGLAQVIVRLRIGDMHVLSRITRKSAAALKLTPGKQVYVQAKSVALLV